MLLLVGGVSTACRVRLSQGDDHDMIRLELNPVHLMLEKMAEGGSAHVLQSFMVSVLPLTCRQE
jgi:hypothetical protein